MPQCNEGTKALSRGAHGSVLFVHCISVAMPFRQQLCACDGQSAGFKMDARMTLAMETVHGWTQGKQRSLQSAMVRGQSRQHRAVALQAGRPLLSGPLWAAIAGAVEMRGTGHTSFANCLIAPGKLCGSSRATSSKLSPKTHSDSKPSSRMISSSLSSFCCALTPISSSLHPQSHSHLPFLTSADAWPALRGHSKARCPRLEEPCPLQDLANSA